MEGISNSIVEDFYLGKTHILICNDEYINKSQTENQRIKDEVNSICGRIAKSQIVK
ncbi:hypothetical protein [Ruminiclostridium josui]|uniref:hypothetical protein n=1 Tax=Ruminiclostridium josui TaxID=1499 RepID=UPI0004BB7807|nr:hypothetical protein [Ruminiclostridium josui]